MNRMPVSFKVTLGLIVYLFIADPFTAGAVDNGEVTEEQCTTKDFSERFGPIRDQGNSAFCYAFASADVIGEALELHSKQQLSGMYFCTQFMSLTPSEIAQ